MSSNALYDEFNMINMIKMLHMSHKNETESQRRINRSDQETLQNHP